MNISAVNDAPSTFAIRTDSEIARNLTHTKARLPKEIVIVPMREANIVDDKWDNPANTTIPETAIPNTYTTIPIPDTILLMCDVPSITTSTMDSYPPCISFAVKVFAPQTSKRIGSSIEDIARRNADGTRGYPFVRCFLFLGNYLKSHR